METREPWYLKEPNLTPDLKETIEHLQPAIKAMQDSIENFFATPPLEQIKGFCYFLENRFPTRDRRKQAQILRQMLSAIYNAGDDAVRQANMELADHVYGHISCYFSSPGADGLYMLLLMGFLFSSAPWVNESIMHTFLNVESEHGLDSRIKKRDFTTKLYAELSELNFWLKIKPGSKNGRDRSRDDDVIRQTQKVILDLKAKGLSAGQVTLAITAGALKTSPKVFSDLGKTRALQLRIGNQESGAALGRRLKRRGIADFREFVNRMFDSG